jgi:hypothetical protein
VHTSPAELVAAFDRDRNDLSAIVSAYKQHRSRIDDTLMPYL